MEKTLKYSVHIYGELEKVLKCQLGTYHVDFENKVFFFESNDKDVPYHSMVRAAEVMANFAIITHNKSTMLALFIHKKCALLNEEDVQKEDDKFVYDFQVEGEIQKLVETKVGSLYVDKENEVFYFDSVKKGFMEPILKKKFYVSIERDLDSDDSESQLNAEYILSILENWTELDDDDIIREKSSN